MGYIGLITHLPTIYKLPGTSKYPITLKWRKGGCEKKNLAILRRKGDLLEVVGKKQKYSPNNGLMVIYLGKILKKSPKNQIQGY